MRSILIGILAFLTFLLIFNLFVKKKDNDVKEVSKEKTVDFPNINRYEYVGEEINGKDLPQVKAKTSLVFSDDRYVLIIESTYFKGGTFRLTKPFEKTPSGGYIATYMKDGKTIEVFYYMSEFSVHFGNSHMYLSNTKEF